MSEMNTNKIPGDSRPRHNIVLIGFMGTGKSSVAQYLHDTCHMEVADMDEIIAARENMSIPEIFSLKGETFLRRRRCTSGRKYKNHEAKQLCDSSYRSA